MEKYINMIQNVRGKLLIQYRQKKMDELTYDVLDNQLWEIIKAMMEDEEGSD